ncbi:uncharacterized protein PRCAT00000485001 [Priceomyces carsonii]|uniref:uncharacterized protein n=1 Tax=Priceomyces carsonii TaxID=28549 RepID=UPI002ED9CA4D|nr:unnamed protein product [Priceomyces carsonii]
MSDISSRIREFFGFPSYEPLNNDGHSQTFPGAYPENEGVAQDTNRNFFNSQRLSKYLLTLLDWIIYLIIKPIALILAISLRVLGRFFNMIYFKERNNRRTSLIQTGYNQGNDPIDKVNKFIRELEDNLSPENLRSGNSLPPFFEGSYTQALYMATNRAKFLFVYLSNPQNESSSLIFDKVIANPEFINMFSNNQNLLIWGGDLTNSEAYQLANSFGVTKFPFLGLVFLTRTTRMTPDGPVKTSPKITLVLKIQGGLGPDVDPNALIELKFKKKIRKYDAELSLIRNQLKESFMSQVLLKQQDLNYRASLEKDRVKAQKKLQEKMKKKFLAYKLEYFNNLNEEITEGMAKIAIKLQSGSRVTFYFPAESKVEDIFTYVELLNEGYFDKEISSSLSDQQAEEEFKGFEPDFNFKLITPLPPRSTLNDFIDCKIKDVKCIYPNGLVIAENI